MLVIGITGNLAAGKTTVIAMFQRCGARVFNADLIAHRALARGSACYRPLVKRFGRGIVNSRGGIDRKKLASAGFHRKSNHRDLCAIIHPWVWARLQKKIAACRKNRSVAVVCIEAALLVEAGWHRSMDRVIVVKSTIAQQRGRAEQFRNMPIEQFQRRIRFQLPLREKIKYADYVIDNRGTLHDIEQQVRVLCKQFAL